MDDYKFKDGYQYNDSGYFVGTMLCQIGEGIYLPPNTTYAKPMLNEGYWYKYNSEKDSWDSEKIPTTLEEIKNTTVKFTDNSEQGMYLRHLMEAVLQENEDYYLDRSSEDINEQEWSIKKYSDEYLYDRELNNKTLELSSKYNIELNTCIVSVDLGDDVVLKLSTGNDTMQTLTQALTLVQNNIPFTWIDDDGNSIILEKPEEVIKCIKVITEHNTKATEKWGEYKKSIESAKTVEDLKNINIEFHGENDG